MTSADMPPRLGLLGRFPEGDDARRSVAGLSRLSQRSRCCHGSASVSLPLQAYRRQAVTAWHRPDNSPCVHWAAHAVSVWVESLMSPQSSLSDDRVHPELLAAPAGPGCCEVPLPVLLAGKGAGRAGQPMRKHRSFQRERPWHLSGAGASGHRADAEESLPAPRLALAPETW
jgi:hypothetical protein